MMSRMQIYVSYIKKIKRILCRQKRHNYVKNGSSANNISMESMSRTESVVFRSQRSRHLDLSVPNSSKPFNSIFNHEVLRPGDMRCKMAHLTSPRVRNLLPVANSGQNHQTPPEMHNSVSRDLKHKLNPMRYCDFSSNIGIQGSQIHTSQNLK